MLFNFNLYSSLLLIGVVALIVIGPKDLPHLFHSLGRFTARARSMGGSAKSRKKT